MRASDIDAEQRYRDIFEHTPLGLWEEDYTELFAALESLKAAGVRDFDAHFTAHPALLGELARKVKILDVNRACVALYGARTKDQILGSLGEIFCEESLPVFRAQLLVLASGGREFSSDSYVRTLDGEGVWVFLTVSILPPRSGVIRALVSTLEISQRRQMEDAVCASRERYAELYDNAPDMSASLDPRTGSIVQCNQTMATSLGHTKSDLAGRAVLDVVHPDWADEVTRTLERLAREDTVECRHVRLGTRTGEVIDTSLKISAVRDEGGRVVWHSAVWRDISEQRIAEEELASKEKLYRTLTESIPHMIWLGDERGHVTYCNQAMADITGIGVEGMSGRDWSDIVHPGDREEILALQEVARWSGIQYRGECRIRGAEGTNRTVYFIVTPVKDSEGDIIHWVGVNTDITRLKKAQTELQRALERSNMELAQIAHAASHDLQEPLRMVTSYVQLLAQRYAGKLDTKADKYIGYAVQGAKRIRRLIRDLLTFSQIGMEGTAQQPIDCARALAQAESSLQQELIESDAEIACETAMPLVMGDAVQIALLFRCLLSNSIKFRGEAAPRVVVSARRDGTMWLFAVKDNGIGFDNDYGERIFQMFQRLHPRGAYAGTGIGLTLAKKIVEGHGGFIWVDSASGQGATFYFTLPVVGVELVEG